MTCERRERFDVRDVMNSRQLFVGRIATVDFLRLKSLGNTPFERATRGLKTFGTLGVIAPRAMLVEECIIDDE